MAGAATEHDVQHDMLDVLQRLGWTLRRRDELAVQRASRMNDAIVEPLLVEALQRINDGLSADDAKQLAAQVRRVTGDREMLEVLREGINFKPDPSKPARTVWVIDLNHPERNDFTVTEEFSIETGGAREPRLDVVCLVNGLPLGTIENKSPSHGLDEAAGDWRMYWQDAPQLVALNAVVGVCNGLFMRVGPSGLEDLAGYMEWKDPWPLTVQDPDDEMEVTLAGAYAPAALVDLAVNFRVFETREGITTKKLARYQQYRAANKLVERVRQGRHKRGIIWHATGSGKSLTMLFAALKLLRAGVGCPTVLIVVDRRDLDDQINKTLLACDFDGVTRASGQKALQRLLAAGRRGVIVTTVHKFDEGTAGALSRENVAVFVDEAHRTQFGGLAAQMRAAMPNASFFGFTGTPIELEDRSTREWFSPEIDGAYEPYMDRYGFDQAIRDGATVPVLHQPRLEHWRVMRADLDERFQQAFGHLREEDQERLRRDATRDAVVAKAPARVEAIAADVASLMHERILPNGMKGQLVAVDREACAAYAEELAKHFKPEAFAVIMSRDLKRDSAELRRWWTSEQWRALTGAATEAEPNESDLDTAEGDRDKAQAEAAERRAIRGLIERFNDPDDPLCLLIVNSMLLTGFDAPIEQAMFLDRGLKEHTLLQAIARTNRRYPDKDYGLIFDYWGVLSDLDEALKQFASEDVRAVSNDGDALLARFPQVVKEGLAVEAGAPQDAGRRRRALWLVRRLRDDAALAAAFEHSVKSAQSLYETLAPDPRLVPHLPDYRRLLELYAEWRRGTRQDTLAGYRAKTRALVQESIDVVKLETDLPVRRIDGNYLTELHGDEELTPEEKATDIEAALVHEIKVRGDDDPVSKTLAQRLEALRQRREQEHQMTIDLLAGYEQVAQDFVGEQEAAERLGLSDAAHALQTLARRELPEASDEELAALARRLEDKVRPLFFEGWQDREDAKREVRKALIVDLAGDETTRGLAASGYVDEALQALTARSERA
jgi:type I restriction enzyme R subunit